jgi:hypothetical protein
MAFDCRVYRILIASPSDVDEEREIVTRAIQEWNDLHSYSRKVALLPLRWETHTAPEYGTRPQEVINRVIVDQCDLLVGIFWTRIGSPTGDAESGTLEEIERVARAGKPVMLYFSRIGIDPGVLDLGQVERLKQFKERTSPNALTESYKSHIEFHDKFAKQLELKIRDLQQADDSGGRPPLELSFWAPDTGKMLGPSLAVTAKVPIITDLDAFKKTAGRDSVVSIERVVNERIREAVAIPTVLAIRNVSSFGVRDLFVEITVGTESQKVEIAQTIGRSGWSSPIYATFNMFGGEPSPVETAVTERLSHFEEQGLSKDENAWKLSFEWGALQPQRTRLIKPPLFIMSGESAEVTFTARLFADGFPQPLAITAQLNITVEPVELSIEQLIPDIREQLTKKTAVGLASSSIIGAGGNVYFPKAT